MLLLLASVLIVPQSLQAQSPTATSPPANVTVTAGDAEALITWQSGGNGVNGTCATEEYYVYIYNKSTWESVEDSEYIPQSTSTISWHVDELSPSTTYYAEVYAYGSACEYESDTATTFTTTAANSGGDPTRPSGNKKKAPRPVRNLSVTAGATSTAAASWDLPSTNVGNRRCATANPQVHAYYVDNLTTDETDDEGEVVGATGASSVTLTGLTKGHRYMLMVESYSSQCDAWSKEREFVWTQ